MNLEVKYLGLELKNPIVIGSSPFTSSLEDIQKMERCGAGAVVLKSIFEEQIADESDFLDSFKDYPEAADYLNHYVKDDYLAGHLKLIEEAKKSVKIPIIASINCTSKGSWLEYAKKIEKAGADALELNIFTLACNINESSADMEANYLKTIENVAKQLTIPVSVKLSMRFTNVLSICKDAYYRGAKGVIMYNKIFEPTIDINTKSVVVSDKLSSPNDLHYSLRNVAITASQLPMLDIAVSKGVHSGEDAVRAILAGAKVVQIVSTIFINGEEVIEEIKKFISEWMVKNGHESVSGFCGMMKYKIHTNEKMYQRAQYMKHFPNR